MDQNKDGSSLIRITYKSPDSDGRFEEYSLMPNKYLNMMAAQLVPFKSSVTTLSNQDRNAIMVYREVRALEDGSYRLSDEHCQEGFSCICFLSEVRNITVLIPNCKIDPHGYIEPIVQADAKD